MLYLIPFLHQTTTTTRILLRETCCILFHFYIKPQHHRGTSILAKGCILFHFYIKPQRSELSPYIAHVVSYSISTSNHNFEFANTTAKLLYLIPFLHQTTTLLMIVKSPKELYLIPFLHQTTTIRRYIYRCSGLYLIPFLHQTTTTVPIPC